VVVAVALTGCALPRSPAKQATLAAVEPSAIALARPFDPDDDARTYDQYAAQISLLRAALSRVTSCAALPDDAVRLILIEQMTLQQAGKSHIFSTPASAAVLLIDGRQPPELIEGHSSPGTFVSRVGQRAASFYDMPGCTPSDRQTGSPGGTTQ